MDRAAVPGLGDLGRPIHIRPPVARRPQPPSHIESPAHEPRRDRARYISRLARPVDAYAMGFIGGCGCASNCVYVCEPAASMRICAGQGRELVSMSGAFGMIEKVKEGGTAGWEQVGRDHSRRRPCCPPGRRSLALRKPAKLLVSTDFVTRLSRGRTVVQSPSCSMA